MDAAATEMARYYGLPAESSPGGSDAHILNFQNAHENAIMGMPTMLSWPDIIVGPGGDYLCEPSTVGSVRSEDWYISDFGSHESYESWITGGKKDILQEARDKVDCILGSHEPLPLGADVENELDKICKRAREN